MIYTKKICYYKLYNNVILRIFCRFQSSRPSTTVPICNRYRHPSTLNTDPSNDGKLSSNDIIANRVTYANNVRVISVQWNVLECAIKNRLMLEARADQKEIKIYTFLDCIQRCDFSTTVKTAVAEWNFIPGYNNKILIHISWSPTKEV